MEDSPRIQQIREMLKAEPMDAFLNYALAIELEKENKLTEAVELLKQMVRSHQDYLPIYYKIGKLLEHLGKLTDAKHYFLLGKELATRQHNLKTKNELEEALWMLDDE